MLEQLVEQYQSTSNEEVLTQILNGVKGIYYMMSSRHMSLIKDSVLIEEICQDTLIKCMPEYNMDLGKFFTFYVTCCNNACLSMVTKLNKNKVSETCFLEFDNESDKVSTLDLIEAPNSTQPYMTVDESIDMQSLKSRLKHILSEKEYKLCCLVLDTPYKLKNKDIASITGMSPSTISLMFTRLKTKLKPDVISII